MIPEKPKNRRRPRKRLRFSIIFEDKDLLIINIPIRVLFETALGQIVNVFYTFPGPIPFKHSGWVGPQKI